MRDTVREYLMGPGDVTMTLSISFSWIFFFFYLLLDILSVTYCILTSCVFIGQGLLSSTLVKLSTPNQDKNADMLELKSCGNNKRDESKLPETWGDRLEIPGIHIFICSELCANMSTKAEFEFDVHGTFALYDFISDSS